MEDSLREIYLDLFFEKMIDMSPSIPLNDMDFKSAVNDLNRSTGIIGLNSIRTESLSAKRMMNIWISYFIRTVGHIQDLDINFNNFVNSLTKTVRSLPDISSESINHISFGGNID